MKLFFSLTLFLLTNSLFSQIKTDTIFKTAETKVDLSPSIIKKINDRIEICKICVNHKHVDAINKKNLILGYGLQENHIDSLLNEYSDLSKSKILLEFDALIYSSYCETYEPITETYVLEFFYCDESKAKECISILEQLVADRENTEMEPKEIKTDEALIGIYSWFFIQNENRVYFVHRRIEHDENNPITAIFKKKIIPLLNE